MRIRLNRRSKPRRDLSWRLRIPLLIMAAFWGILILRNIEIAVFRHESFRALAVDNQTAKLHVRESRGNIYDRTGEALSWNIPTSSIFAIPDSISNHEMTAIKLAAACDIPSSTLLERFNKHTKFCWVDRAITLEEKDRVQQMNLGWVYITAEQKRGYRNGNDWLYLLGGTDIDGRGIGGVELAFDKYLQGQDKEIRVNRDRKGRKFDLDGSYASIQDGGDNIILTIDANLQDILCQKLKAGVEEFQAKGAFGVFLGVGTSEILAMGQYFPENVSATRNVVISDVYEPGSTYKLVTVAAALNSGKYTPSTIIDCQGGKFCIGPKCITDAHKMGCVTLRKAVEYSSNVAATKMSFKLGRDAIYRMMIDFGFDTRTGIELPGESAGQIHDPETWSELEQAAVSFGNGLTVTALQLANAYAAVGAGGELYRPYLLKTIVSPQGEIIKENKPTKVRRVISPQTAATMMEFFGVVVDSGTAVQAKIDGLKIAGKTGTSRKVIPGGGGYSDDKFYSSFVGFYPADNPVILGYIVFDEPTVKRMGGSTAAPVFRDILKEYFCSSKRLLEKNEIGFDPRLDLCSAEGADSSSVQPVANFARELGTPSPGADKLSEQIKGKPLRNAIFLLRHEGYEVEIEGDSGIVLECYPINDGETQKYFIKCG